MLFRSIPHHEAVAIGSLLGLLRKGQSSAMHFLKTVLEHGPIDFVKECAIYFDPVVRRYAQEVGVKGTVVNLAETNPISHRCRAVCMRVRDDVGGVKESPVFQIADGASDGIRPQNACSEFWLVEPLTYDSLRIGFFK